MFSPKWIYLTLELLGFAAFDRRLFPVLAQWLTGETDRNSLEQWNSKLIPIRWLLVYCAVIDIATIPHYTDLVYFRLYWYLTIPELVWLAYLGQHVCRKFSDTLQGSRILHGSWIYVIARSVFMWNLPAGRWPLHTRRAAEMRDFAIEVLLVAAGVILLGILILVGRRYSKLAFAVLILVLSALIPLLWWAYRGYNAQIWGISWAAGLLVLLCAGLGLGSLNGHRNGLSRKPQSELRIAHRAQR